MKIPIPENCLVCQQPLLSEVNKIYEIFSCAAGHEIYIGVEQHDGSIKIHYLNIYLPDGYLFMWDVLSNCCFIIDKTPNYLTGINTIVLQLPWIDIPSSINIDELYSKVKTWITFS